MMLGDADVETGYEPAALDAWSERVKYWSSGASPQDLPSLESAQPGPGPRDVFVYFINGAKERAPAAALALLERLKL
ncbi:MAG: hypothetical protein JWP47_2405 [Polaromonas sp.]|nr:hypothetical protein [Polaromonas sp.]